jgi:hypothetical protein
MLKKEKEKQMFNARAIFKTSEEGVFTDAGFTVEVDLTVDHELGMDKTSKLFDYIQSGKCDGFEIDLGTGKKYMVKS